MVCFFRKFEEIPFHTSFYLIEYRKEIGEKSERKEVVPNMKKYTVTMLAGSLAAAMLLSAFTYPEANLSDVVNPMVETVSELSKKSDQPKNLSFGKKFQGYRDEKSLLSSEQKGSYQKYSAKEVKQPNLETIKLSFSQADAVSTVFDFTLNQTSKQTITVDADIKGKAKVILTKDKKSILPVWENKGTDKVSKTFALEKGRYRVRLVTEDAKGEISISVDKKNSLFSYTTARAEKAYEEIMKPAAERYRKAVDKAYSRYDKSVGSANELYDDEAQQAQDKYEEKMEQLGEFEYSSYLSAEEGKEMDKEYQKKYSDTENRYDEELSASKDSFYESVELADSYLEERLNRAEQELEDAGEEAQKAWDAIIHS